MTELGLILGINIAGLAFALGLARWIALMDAGPGEVRRLVAAIERASLAFLGRQYRSSALAVLSIASAVFILYGYLSRTLGPFGNLEAAFFSALALAFGSVSAILVAQFTTRHGIITSARCVGATRVSLDHALATAVRGSGAIGLLLEAVSALGPALLFLLLITLKGSHLSAAGIPEIARDVSMLLPGYALGAAVTALIFQRAGAVYHAASDVGGDLAGERDASLEPDDARNPAAVADLVGDHVGAAVSRSLDLFVSATLANVIAMIVGAHLAEAATPTSAGMAWLALPLSVKAFGVIACGFGVMVTRTTDAQGPDNALWRGHIATLVISIGGLAGATWWQLQDHWPPFFLAGVIALLSVLAVSHLARLRLSRRFSSFRDVGDALRVGDTTAVAQALAIGLQSAVLPCLILGATLAVGWQLGDASGLANGGALALLTSLMAMLATGPFMLAIGGLGPIADSARGIHRMTRDAHDDDAGRRSARLDEAGIYGAGLAKTFLIVVGAVAALSSIGAFLILASPQTEAGSSTWAAPIVIYSGALGASAILAYAGSAMRSATFAARNVALEVERQLRGFPRERGLAQVPRDFTPSYRACIDVAGRAAHHRVLLPVLASVALPAALAIGLGALYDPSRPGLAANSLAAFVAFASVTGLAGALAIDVMRGALSAARRSHGPKGSAINQRGVNADAVGDLVGHAAGPAASFVVKACAVSALAIAPFLA